MLRLKSFSARTDQGPYLQINEDDIEIDLVNNLFMLFDGFGGNNAGDVAVKFLKEKLKVFYSKVGGDPDATLPFFYSPRYLIEGNALINSMRYAHSLLCSKNQQLAMNERGGSSAIVAAMADNILTVASTGNCKGHLCRHGRLQPLNTPDTLIPLTSYDHTKHFYTSPISGFGLFDHLDLDVREFRLRAGDMVVLISDGVYSRVHEEELSHILNLKQDDGDKIDQLFDLANERGNMDNQSAVILQF